MKLAKNILVSKIYYCSQHKHITKRERDGECRGVQAGNGDDIVATVLRRSDSFCKSYFG